MKIGEGLRLYVIFDIDMYFDGLYCNYEIIQHGAHDGGNDRWVVKGFLW